MEEKMPFLGIPFTTKDCIGVKGMLQTAGLVSKKGTKAVKDADVIVLLREAGAIPLAITNVSELCMWWEASNNLYGRSNNPYNTTRIVGGSSGGEGCLLASAGSVIGIGSDIGGSIRIPSFINGIFGHKSSTGIVSNQGEYPSAEKELDSFLSTGPMCRYACDLLPLFKVLAGKNASKLKLDTKVNIRYLKVYYMEDDGGNPCVTQVCTEMKMAMKKVITHLENMYGIKSQKIHLSKMKYSFYIWAHKMASVDAPSFSSEMLERKGELNGLLELLKWMCMLSKHTLPAIGLSIFEKLCSAVGSEERSQFVNMCTDLQCEFQELLGDEGIFLYPPHPEPALFHHQTIFKTYSIGYTAIFNVLGLPVTQCPLGLSKDGLPLGIQVVAGKNNDHLTLALAVELEKMFGGWVCPSPIL
ncbi:fatty-acid amide hydrolase 2-like [Limulus polyphemus]|uniref:Fatty-acid amide hydrolase 2-like n=1 Tax=Limulus polyphemus TaxID=6850 RepID=A0ABM1B7F9_LIMPO|nr:fatty-acid amide hydrolase 2-like [Limulus polyphemus]